MAQKIIDSVRKSYLDRISAMFTDAQEEVLETGSNEICMPWAEGDEEGFVIVKVTIPKGQRDGDAYDGYVEADGYAAKVKAKKEKAEQATKEKEAKKARDAKARAAKKAAAKEKEDE